MLIAKDVEKTLDLIRLRLRPPSVRQAMSLDMRVKGMDLV